MPTGREPLWRVIGVPLVLGELEDALQHGKVLDPRSELPAPVAPVRRRNVGEEALLEGARLLADGIALPPGFGEAHDLIGRRLADG